MEYTRITSLFIALCLWANLVFDFAFPQFAFLPGFLSHLPQSDFQLSADYVDLKNWFWPTIHPLAFAVTIAAIILHWKSKKQRMYLVGACVIYLFALIATATYLIPQAIDLSQKISALHISAAEYRALRHSWEMWSRIRGIGLLVGFVLLVFAMLENQKTID